jgi:hypothetical protein
VRFVIPLLLGVAVAPCRAQSPSTTADSAVANPLARSSRASRPRIGRNTCAMLAGAAGVGAAISLFDSPLLVGAERLGGDDMRSPSSIGNFVGGPGPLTLGASLYLLGRGTGKEFATNTGREVIRAVLVSGAFTAVTKGAVGRARPFAAPGDPDEFSPGRGFTNAAFGSFPSGHTSAAFATAMVLARELHTRHPERRSLINSLLFGGATFVGFSRVYDRQHWPSDVVAGAALGGITGYEVVAHAHGDRSPINRHLFSHIALSSSRSGVVIDWSNR